MDFLSTINFETVLHSKIFIIVVTLLALVIVLKILNIIIDRFSKKIIKRVNDDEYTKQMHSILIVLKSTVDLVVSAIFLMGLMTKIGFDIRPILTAAGVLGVAIGIGAKRFVEDIIGGILFILEGQVRVGDIVEMNGKSGTVEKLNLKMVVLRDLQGRVHYIRNGLIDIVTNYTREYSYYLMDLKVAYKENVDHIMNVLREIYNEQLKTNSELSDKIYEDLEIMGVDAFEDSGVIIKLRIKTKPMFSAVVGREYNRLIKNKFDELNIEIPFKQTIVHFDNAPTLKE